MSGGTENNRYIVQVFVGALSQHYEALSVEASKQTTSDEIVSCIVERLSLADSPGGSYELAEVIGDSVGQECKERRLGPTESPVALMLLWPKLLHSQQEYYRFYLREKLSDSLWTDSFTMDPQLIRDYFYRFLYQPKDREYPDLCQLPDLNEVVLLDNLRARFIAGHIYTYVGSILIAVNPFKFHPIYNPKYVKLYQNRRLGPELPPHIFAVADAAYHCMLKERRNQCIVISGESGSGKTESTNFLLHHLTALSQKGSHGSGVEQTILSAGPVLEAFGNAKTAHNNNSSRFGKFIQVNYKENGMVHGAVVQKYLLEKSRICSQGRNERNYHVFYYLLAGASDAEKNLLHLQKTEDYSYLSKSGCYILDNVDEKYEFSRLKQSMEMVGFTPEKQRRLFAVLSAVLLLGNVEFQPRKLTYHHDEAVGVRNPEVVLLISELLRVKQETLLQALTAKRARASGETLVINYRLPEAIAARDAMAKCLYGALFDWIVLQVNHALLSKKDTLRDHQGNSIGVLDIFGFEDFGLCNSFEQFCINYANEHLQYYFNQHVFKYEQEEYRKEGIRWTDIEFMDNTACLQLIEGKPNGLLCMLDDQCNFPGATNETLLQKFNSVHKENNFYEIPQRREAAFIVRHYAGKVKYQVTEMREKNLDLMRQDIVGVLKNSSMAFVRELVGADPVAVFRWAIVRAFFRGYFAFHEAGRRHRQYRDGNKPSAIQSRYRNHTPNENLISFSPKHNSNISGSSRSSYGYQKQRNINSNESQVGLQSDPSSNHNRLSWPQFRNTSTSSSQQRNEREFSNIRETPPSPVCDNVSPMISLATGVQESTRARRDSMNRQQGALERVLCPDEAKVLERANQIVMKNKSFRPRERGKKGLKNLQTVKTLAGRTQSYGCSNQQLGKARKQPLTVTAQFQQSLHSLMDTLNQANPFFIRCIKSNSHKIPNKFDDDTVQRQLRYTGMLETVRIRQAGYNVRLTYDEFIQLYRILLPKGLVSSQADVRDFLFTLNLNRDNYQLGTSKIFLRESEKVKLDYRLHQQIMASIVAIQRWTRAVLERRRFLRLREAVILIQSQWRMVMAQRLLNQTRIRLAAALQIQRAWRSHKASAWYRKLRSGIVVFQAHIRGCLARRRFREAKQAREEEARHQVSNVDAHSAQSTDEAFLSKESSQEELDERLEVEDRELEDSEESSGIQEDSESEPILPESTSSAGPVDTASRPSRSSALLSASSTDKKVFRMNEPSKQPLGLEVTYSKKKISVKRSKGVKTEAKDSHKTYQEEKMSGKFSTSAAADSGIGGALSVTERKGSSDSLTSQKSIESQRSSDSQSSAPVRDTLHKAKRQIQALIGVGKKSDKWDGGTAPQAHSDGEVDETIPTTTRSAPTIISSAPSNESFSGSDHKSVHSVWRKRPDLTFDLSDGSSLRKSVATDLTDASHDSRLSSTSSSEMCIVAPSVRRESKLSRQEAASAFLFAEQRSRTPLKTSVSHDERHSLRNPDPEVPVRMTRRQRAPREVVCRSVGEELTDTSSVDPTGNPLFLGTIRESNISSDGSSAGENRTIWASRKEPRSSDGSESSYASRLSSSQEAEWSPDLDTSAYTKSGLQIHSVATKRSRSGAITSLELKRRNSDPATKCGTLITGQPAGADTPAKVSDVLEWKGNTMFTIAGHRFRKVARFSKEDRCVSCDKSMDAFVTQGHKCSDCKQLFHTKCIQNGGVLRIPCQQQQSSHSVRRNKRKTSRTQHDMVKPASGSKFNLTGTSEFTDSTDKIISDATELQLMQDFITQKIYKIESEEVKKPSEVDRVFKQALREFKDNLVATYSVMNKQGAEGLNIKYKDLIANFLHVMETVCNQEQTREDFPVTMGVNAFRGFMNEFMNLNRLEEKPNKAKRKKEKKRKVEDPIAYAGHTFLLTIINIPTACEICTSFFMWPIERGLVCQNCKLTCHKKCYSKVTVTCGKDGMGGSNQEGSRVFGVPLHQLAVGDGKVPIVVDRLITTIEMYGLYTEGIYRKSGVSSKVKELKSRMEEGNIEGVNFQNYQVHVLAAVLKSFFREMPEPLLTFDSYEDFLRAANLTDPQDRVSTLFTILKKLPKPNFDLMERLIFHLARVALHEEANRMNASALAIVFAPCILRTNKIVPAQDSLHDIGRQTQCIETIVAEQLRKVRSTLADIDTLDTACHTATHRLSSLRSSKIFSPEELLPVDISNSDPKPTLLNPDDEEALLMGHIQEIQKEKALLTSALPSLTRTTSDDDLLSTDMDDGSLDDVIGRLEEGEHEPGHHGRRVRGTPVPKSLVSRSMSGGDGEPSGEDVSSKLLQHSSGPVRLKRQSSSDNSIVSLYPPVEVDCDEDPIMV